MQHDTKYLAYEGVVALTNTDLTDPRKLPKLEECESKKATLCLIPGKNWSKAEDIENITLSGKPAVSFFVSETKRNSVLHVVQTTQSPLLQIVMTVDGVGLEEEFNQILSSLTFMK